MSRRTDDAVILQMLREGKSQQEISDYFGVTRQAITKRVKLLNPKPDLSHLTSKERSFVEEVAKGKGHVEAALKSFDVRDRHGASNIGMSLMKKPEITESITALMEYNGLSRDYRIKKLRSHVDHADPNVSLKALDMSFKLDSSYPPAKSVNMNLEGKITHVVDLSKYRLPDSPHQVEIVDAEFTQHEGRGE